MCQSSGVIFISIAKLSDRCFCYVTSAMFVSLRGAQTWRLHTKPYKFGWHTSANSARMKNSKLGCLYSPTSIKRPPIKRPPSIKRPLSKVPIYLSVNCCTWYLYSTATSIKRPRPPFCCRKLITTKGLHISSNWFLTHIVRTFTVTHCVWLKLK